MSDMDAYCCLCEECRRLESELAAVQVDRDDWMKASHTLSADLAEYKDHYLKRGEELAAMHRELCGVLAERSEVADTDRVLSWFNSTPRKSPELAFTAGPERQAAYWIAWTENRTKADLAEAVAALKPFAERAVYYAQRTSDGDDESAGVAALGDFRRAARIVQKHNATANTENGDAK